MSSVPLFTSINNERLEVTQSVMEFSFINSRINILSSVNTVKNESKGIIYWMFRDMRVQDNWSFLYAQKLALKNKISLHVFYILIPNFLNASRRHYKFLLQGLKEVAEECSNLNISFHLNSGDTVEQLVEIVKKNNIGGLVCDFSPLRSFRSSTEKLKNQLPSDVLFCQVDGHNIVPCWEASSKQEVSARTFRPKVTEKLTTYLTPFPPLIKHPYSNELIMDECTNNWSEFDDAELPNWIKPGYKNGIEMLESFCKVRLKDFATKRNIPEIDAASNLSPWINFGQIAPQRCVLEVWKQKIQHTESVNDFCEQIIVRRELSDNYCYYNENYDNYEGAPDWAKNSLNAHSKDPRTHFYSLEQFEKAETHEPLWNAAQLELVKNGKMHGYLRMYWAKKILEWAVSPEEAIKIAVYLNDHYSFDGRDPNGYVGIMWSICGLHDQGWKEREVFGKIRYMNFNGCKRKFDVLKYIEQWGSTKDTQTMKTNTNKKRKLK